MTVARSLVRQAPTGSQVAPESAEYQRPPRPLHGVDAARRPGARRCRAPGRRRGCRSRRSPRTVVEGPTGCQSPTSTAGASPHPAAVRRRRRRPRRTSPGGTGRMSPTAGGAERPSDQASRSPRLPLAALRRVRPPSRSGAHGASSVGTSDGVTRIQPSRSTVARSGSTAEWVAARIASSRQPSGPSRVVSVCCSPSAATSGSRTSPGSTSTGPDADARHEPRRARARTTRAQRGPAGPRRRPRWSRGPRRPAASAA